MVDGCGVSDGSLAAAFEALVFMIAAMRSQDELRTQDIYAHIIPGFPGRDGSAATAPSESVPRALPKAAGAVWCGTCGYHTSADRWSGWVYGGLSWGTHWTDVCARDSERVKHMEDLAEEDSAPIRAVALRVRDVVANAVALAGKHSTASPVPGHVRRELERLRIRLHARLYDSAWIERLFDTLETPLSLRVRRGTDPLTDARRKAFVDFGYEVHDPPTQLTAILLSRGGQPELCVGEWVATKVMDTPETGGEESA